MLSFSSASMLGKHRAMSGQMAGEMANLTLKVWFIRLLDGCTACATSQGLG